MLTENRVLAVDDDPTNLAIIRESLGDKYELRTVLDGTEAVRLAKDFRPQVVLLDIMMPNMDGYEVCRRIRSDSIARYCRIILVSAKTEVADRLAGYESGADDYLTKPFVDDELEAKVRVALNMRTVDEFTIVRDQVERMCGLNGEALALISQLRDTEDGSHLVNVRGVSHILAAELRHGPYESQISDEFLDNLYVASILHDVGKIAVSDHILFHDGQLTLEEWKQLQEHTVAGERILKHLAKQHSKSAVYEMSAAVARWHHECFDGTGYPDGISGQRIPLAARIVSVADVFDVSLREMSRSEPADLSRVRDQIAGYQAPKFDPVIVNALQKTFDEVADLYVSEMFVETLQLSN
jgi:putative two-component system response regulator